MNDSDPVRGAWFPQWGGGAGAHGSRLGRRGDDIAGQAKFAFAEEEHGFVLAGLGFARHQQGPVVYVWRMGFAGQIAEAGVAVALAENMHAFDQSAQFIEAHFHHAVLTPII